MDSPFEKIISSLDDAHIPYTLSEHDHVYTSADAARIRGIPLKEGAKALLMKADATFVLVILPGDRRVNSKKLRTLFNAKDVRFAHPDEVKDIMGCEIGACYPIADFLGIRIVVDTSLSHNEYIAFNPGRHDRTIRMRWNDYVARMHPELVDIVEDTT